MAQRERHLKQRKSRPRGKREEALSLFYNQGGGKERISTEGGEFSHDRRKKRKSAENASKIFRGRRKRAIQPS